MFMKNDKIFEQNVVEARKREEAVFLWLRSKGHPVVPFFKWPIEERQGPCVWLPPGKVDGFDALILPDIGCWRHSVLEFIEVKSGKGFSWSRKDRTWQTSVRIKQYQQYVHLAELGAHIWMFFFLEYARPTQSDLLAGSPKECPRGLYGITIHDLEARRKERDGVHSFQEDLYVSRQALFPLAGYDEVLAFFPKEPGEEKSTEPVVYYQF